MFKQLTVLFIMLAFLMQTFNKIFIVTEYYTNTASFAKNCENKSKPQLHCNGKCQMMKKLKQEENKDQRTLNVRVIKMRCFLLKAFSVLLI